MIILIVMIANEIVIEIMNEIMNEIDYLLVIETVAPLKTHQSTANESTPWPHSTQIYSSYCPLMGMTSTVISRPREWN